MYEPSAGSVSEGLPELLALGEHLRDARNRRGLSQDELADRLRLGVDQLDALERGDRSRLPELVFVIAQAKRVAGSLGISIDDQIAALRGPARAESDRRRPPRPAAPEPEATESSSRHRVTALKALPDWLPVAAAAVVALGLTTAFLLSKRQPRVATSSPPAPVAKPAAAGGAVTAPMLELRPGEPSWVAIREPDGRTLFEGILSEPRSFPLGRGLEVRAGRADQVTVAGPGLQPRPLGVSDDFDWKRFSLSPAAPEPPQAPAP